MPTCNYNCTELQDHEQVDCNQYPKGGSKTIGILECDNELVDYSSAVDTQAAIDAGELKLIKGVKAQMPDASPISIDNPVGGCGSPTIVINYDRTITWTDANVTAENVSFYDQLNGRNGQVILAECDTDRLTVAAVEGSFTSTRMIPEAGSDLQKFTVTFSWRQFASPPIYPAPAGIYD